MSDPVPVPAEGEWAATFAADAARSIDRITDAYLTASALSRLLKAPVPTIYRWASEDAWPRTRTRPIRYSTQAASASATRRRGSVVAL